MKCLSCGNDEVFFESYKGWDKVYYQPGTNDVVDTKSVDIESNGDPIECAVCRSLNVEAD